MVYLSVPGLKALGWTFVAIDILLTVGRLVIRWVNSSLQGTPPGIRRYNLDEGFHLLALAAAITYVALQTSGLGVFIKVEEFNLAHKGSVDTIDESRFFHIRFGAVLIFWIGIYSVKFAFMMLYRTLFWISEPFRRAWWTVSAVVVVSFLTSFLACFWVCGYPIHPTGLKQCLNKKNYVLQNNVEYVWLSLNALSSILILLLPLFMVRGLKMRLAKKLSLAALFTVGVVDVFFDFLRTFYTTTSVGVENLWQILEITIAVMLSALIAFRQLFTIREKKSSAAASRDRLRTYKSNRTYDSIRSGTTRLRAHKGDALVELDDMEPLSDGTNARKEAYDLTAPMGATADTAQSASMV